MNADLSNNITRLTSETHKFMKLKIEDFDQLAADVSKKLNPVINDRDDKLKNIYNQFDASVKNIQDLYKNN